MKTEEKTAIEWLCAAPIRSLQDLFESNLASIRLRTAVGITAARALGIESLVSDGKTNHNVAAIVVGKLDYITDTGRSERWLCRLKHLKENGTKIVVDYTDNHIATASLAASFYREAINISDLVVTSSHKLFEHVKNYTGRDSIVLDDPIEVSIYKPIAKKNSTKTALWFGHASNLPYLFDYLVNQYKSITNRRLIVMTNTHQFPDHYVELLDTPNLRNLEILVVPWSKKDLITAASISDFCLIPAGLDDSRKSGASSNRLLTSLALGLPTLADQLDSYTPFKKYFSDIKATKIDDMFDNPEQWFIALEEVQKFINTENNMKSAEKRWANFIKNYITSPALNTNKANA